MRLKHTTAALVLGIGLSGMLSGCGERSPGNSSSENGDDSDDETNSDDSESEDDEDGYSKSEVCERVAEATCNTLLKCGFVLEETEEEISCLAACVPEILEALQSDCEAALTENSFKRSEIDTCIKTVEGTSCDVVCNDADGPLKDCTALAELERDDGEDDGAASCAEECL